MELHQLLRQQEEIARQIAEIRASEKAQAISAVRSIVADHGLTAADCGFGPAAPAHKARKPVAPKYSNGNGKTWSGRGKMPLWMRDMISAGATRESLAISGC